VEQNDRVPPLKFKNSFFYHPILGPNVCVSLCEKDNSECCRFVIDEILWIEITVETRKTRLRVIQMIIPCRELHSSGKLCHPNLLPHKLHPSHLYRQYLVSIPIRPKIPHYPSHLQHLWYSWHAVQLRDQHGILKSYCEMYTRAVTVLWFHFRFGFGLVSP